MKRQARTLLVTKLGLIASVLAMLAGDDSAAAAMLEAAMQTGTVAVLGVDLAARGLKTEDIVAGAKVVDYGGFVDLVTGSDRTVAWL